VETPDVISFTIWVPSAFKSASWDVSLWSWHPNQISPLRIGKNLGTKSERWRKTGTWSQIAIDEEGKKKKIPVIQCNQKCLYSVKVPNFGPPVNFGLFSQKWMRLTEKWRYLLYI
jgi:hypothetical protein